MNQRSFKKTLQTVREFNRRNIGSRDEAIYDCHCMLAYLARIHPYVSGCKDIEGDRLKETVYNELDKLTNHES